MIPEDWEIKKIKDLVRINELGINKNYLENMIEYIDISSVDKGRLIGTQHFKLLDAPSRAKRIVRDNDILISTVRPNLKHFYFVKKSKKNLVASTGFAVITSKTIDPKFLYYYLTTDRYTEYLTAIADVHTSTYPSYNPDIIENSFCPYPRIEEQKVIAKILSDLDSKIEINQKMNDTLEAIGQALFKHWFIDFEFPNDAGKPYKSSGGEMVYSEGVDKQIPKGWTIITMKDLSDLMMGVSPKSSTYNENMDGMPLLNGAADFSNDMFQPRKYTTNPIRISKIGDLIFCIRATIGNLTIADKKYCLGRGVSALTPKSEKYTEFIYYHLKRLFDLLISQAAGSVILGLSKPDIEEIKLPLPKDGIVDNYHKIINPLFIKKNSILKENITLSQIRDTLLPKLMSGQIRVPVEEVS